MSERDDLAAATNIVILVSAFTVVFVFLGLEGLPRTTDDEEKRRSGLG